MNSNNIQFFVYCFILLLIFLYGSTSPVLAAVECTCPTDSQDCTLSTCDGVNLASVDGADGGALTINYPVTAASGILVYGTTLVVEGAALTINGGELKHGRICYTDGDNDTFLPASYSVSAPGASCTAGTQPRSNVNFAYTDCDDGNEGVSQNATCYGDADGDGRRNTSGSAQCVLSSCTEVGMKDAAVAVDCLDSDADVYQSVSTINDDDRDGYAQGSAASNCVGGSATINGRTYYNNSSGTVNPTNFTWLASAQSLGADCNDVSATCNFSRTCYTDADGDTFRTTSSQSVCTTTNGNCATTCTAAYYRESSASVDCNDAHVTCNYSRTCYNDADNDGERSASSASICTTSNGNCATTCNATYDKESSATLDCYDSNASANHSQATPQSTNRGDGSFDWNCDGVATKTWTDTSHCVNQTTSCNDTGASWCGPAPACGVADSWKTGCDSSYCTCNGGVARTQTCL